MASSEGLEVPMDIPIEDTRKLEVDRILKCQPGDWAALKSLLLIKDRFETGPEDLKSKANQATKLLSEAAEKLKAGESYVEVDQNGRTAKIPPQSEPYNPSSAVKEIYKQATDSILEFFNDAAGTDLAELEILQYNENIRDIILKDDPNATILQQISGFIDLKTIVSYIELRKQHEALKARDTTTLSQSEKTESANSTKVLGLMGSMIDEFNVRKGYPSDWNWDKQKNPEVWVAKPSDTTSKEAAFPPGQTKAGDTILGFLPVYKLDLNDKQSVKRCEFAVEVDDEHNLGNMRIATWEEVGKEAGQAYLDQPLDQQLSIPHADARYATPLQKRNYKSLVGFWADYSEDKHRWGRAYCWIELHDGGYDIVNKGCFEKIVGRRRAAMQQIYDLFENDESKYIWRDPSMGRANRSIREGPYGPVTIQRRKMIENGPQTDQQAATGKADQSQSKKGDTELAALLAVSARIEAQYAEMQAKFLELTIAVQKLEQL